MSDQWGNAKQPTDRHRDRDTGLRAEHAYLLLAVFSISAATVLYIVDFQFERFEVNRGAYAILTAFFVAGCCGWLSRSAERRMRRVAVAELQRLSAAVEELREQVQKQQRMTYLPAPRRSAEGQRYIGAVAVGAEDDTTADTTGIDPATIDTLRRLDRRLRRVDNE